MWREHCTRDNLLFITIARTNKVLIFNMDTCLSNIIPVGSEKNKYSQINFDGDYFWLTHSNKIYLTRWNLETDEIVEYNMEVDKEPQEDSVLAIRGTLLVNGALYVLPGMKKAMFKINIKNRDITPLDTNLFSEDDVRKSVFKLYCDCAIVGENQQIIIMKSSDLSLAIIDKDFVEQKKYLSLIHI